MLKKSCQRKKRYVTKKLLSKFVLPSEDELIAKIVAPRGNNLHEVEDCNGDKYLVSMPPKFRNTVWVRRDNFVFLHPIAEGVRVRAEISHVLSTEDILYLRDLSLWPKYFEADAVVMTREAKRGNVSHNANIDEDMLPSASSSDEHESDG